MNSSQKEQVSTLWAQLQKFTNGPWLAKRILQGRWSGEQNELSLSLPLPGFHGMDGSVGRVCITGTHETDQNVQIHQIQRRFNREFIEFCRASATP